MALSISKQYLNPYEKAYGIAKTTALFNKADWEFAATSGNLDK